MQFNLSQDFPVNLTALWLVYGNADYLAAKYRALGSSHLVISEGVVTEERIDVVLERTVSSDVKGIPDWARKMISHDYVMRHENRCVRLSASEASVSLKITPVGSPVVIRGEGKLVQVAEGKTRLVLSFEVECKIPLVGKKVAELFAGKIKEALAEDYEFTLAYVRGS